MLENDPGFARQEVRFELNEAHRKLENIGTLSGRHLSLASFKDTTSPLGHQIPNMVHSIICCKELLSAYDDGGKKPITFAELRRLKPTLHDVFCKAIEQVRKLDREIQHQIARERLGWRA